MSEGRRPEFLSLPPVSSSARHPGALRRGPDARLAFLLLTFGVCVTLLRKVSKPRACSAPLANKENPHRGFRQK